MKFPHVLIAAGIFALAATPSLAADARVKKRFYTPDEVVMIEGRAGVQATIAFADQEQIENVAIGDANSWQVTPNKRANLLFVKPLGATNRTNMTIVTDRRTYLFDLVASPKMTPVYVLRFDYPPEPKTSRAGVGAMTSEEAAAAAAAPSELASSDPAGLNFAWESKGDRKILPARIYDDGDATYLSWPARTAIPAILTVNEKGEEGAVNYAVRGDVLVMDTVPKLIVLRSGRDVATLANLGPARPATPSAASPATPSATQPASQPASATPSATAEAIRTANRKTLASWPVRSEGQ